ncbi:hypothetical protein GE061_015709 [Apolygus lucorum]|uniref:Uncharacterized protein n=1 Tax=Apolygus lucorum TaxID=248454 RepID=A0A6A4J8F4_APOLU|nr:hypothetical protein GE061_015709 [Apolygus lucorum]
MVIVDGISKKEKASKGGFMSFFSRFAGSRKAHVKTPAVIAEITKRKLSQEALPSSMTLKLSTPSGPQTEEPPQMLSDILMNEQLFEIFHGKSLILQAEVTVEKQLDGSPKSMIVSGRVPVTLSKGFRNGKPTREIRVRGHLRRKRSSELEVVNDVGNLNSSERLGTKPGADREIQDKYGLGDRNRPHSKRKKALQVPPPRPPEQLEFQRSAEFRTYSNLEASRKERKPHSGPWSTGESGFLDQENPTGIANWSPYFDCDSPMSGRTVRRNSRKFQENWDLREKTPTPRFSSTMGTRNHQNYPSKEHKKKTTKPSTKKSYLSNNLRKGDWSPFIDIATSSTSNREPKAELLHNKSLYNLNDFENGEGSKSDQNAVNPVENTSSLQQKIEDGDGRRHPQVNKCLLFRPVVVDENEEDACCRSLDEKGLSVARSESVASALREGKLRFCCKEDTFSTDSVHPSINPQDEATQTNGHRRIEISKISHQVGEKLNHLKKTNGIFSKILPKKFSKIDESVIEDGCAAEVCALHKTPKNGVQENGENPIDKLNRVMESKLVQARGCSIDQNINGNKDSLNHQVEVCEKVQGKGEAGSEWPSDRNIPIEQFRQSRGSSVEDYIHPSMRSKGVLDLRKMGSRSPESTTVKIIGETESKSTQARGSSIDDHNRTTNSNGNHVPQKKSAMEQKREYTHLHRAAKELIRETEDKLVQVRGSSIDEHNRTTKSNGDYVSQKMDVLEKSREISPNKNTYQQNQAEKVIPDKENKWGTTRGSILDYNNGTRSKLVQVRERSIDDHNLTAKENGDYISQAMENARKAVHDRYSTHLHRPEEELILESEDQALQPRGRSADDDEHIARSIGEHHLQTLGVSGSVQKMSRGDIADQLKNFNDPDKLNREIESKLVEARSSFDRSYPSIPWSPGGNSTSKGKNIQTLDTPVLKYNGEVENNLLNSRPGRGSSMDEYPQTSWSIGDHAREKLGSLENRVKTLVNTLEDYRDEYAQNSRRKNQDEALPTTQDQSYYAKKLNPITTITISRSRTKFFRYENGLQNSTKEGAQVVTIEAPKGLLYSSTQYL